MDAELRFDGKVAVVTGAGRGLGRSHALMLASRGARVVVNDPGPNMRGEAIGEDPAADVVAEIMAAGGHAIADRNSVVGGAEAIVAAAIDAFGRLDIVVNNAGVVHAGPLADIPVDEWWAAFDVHAKGTIDVTRAAWPYLVRSGAGRVINTASTAMLGVPRMTNYAAAKAAIFGFTRTAALEGAADGIHVNCILPGAWTRMTQSVASVPMLQAMERFYDPGHVAALVGWLAHADTRVTGEAFSVGGGRALRIVLAAGPGVAVAESTPEAWANMADTLLAGPDFDLLGTMYDAFETELRALAPDEAEVILRASVPAH